MTLVPLAAGSPDCPQGGEEFEVGLDANGDGVLETGEVQQSANVCGAQTTDAGATDAGVPTLDAAISLAPPQAVSSGGPVLTAPKVEHIVFGDDANASTVDSLLAQLASPTYWAQLSQYGVGALTVQPSVLASEPPPSTLDDPDIQALLRQNLSAASVWGAPDPATIYLFVLPQGTRFTFGSGAGAIAACTSFSAYHSEATVGSVVVPYGVVVPCPGENQEIDGGPSTTAQQVTSDVSRELVAMATNPHPLSAPAYNRTDDAHAVYTDVAEGEIDNLCIDGSYLTVLPGTGLVVAQLWSNASALAGGDPCFPSGNTGPYFNSVPILTDAIKFDGIPGDDSVFMQNPVTTAGVRIPQARAGRFPFNSPARGPLPVPGRWSPSSLSVEQATCRSRRTSSPGRRGIP